MVMDKKTRNQLIGASALILIIMFGGSVVGAINIPSVSELFGQANTWTPTLPTGAASQPVTGSAGWVATTTYTDGSFDVVKGSENTFIATLGQIVQPSSGKAISSIAFDFNVNFSRAVSVESTAMTVSMEGWRALPKTTPTSADVTLQSAFGTTMYLKYDYPSTGYVFFWDNQDKRGGMVTESYNAMKTAYGEKEALQHILYTEKYAQPLSTLDLTFNQFSKAIPVQFTMPSNTAQLTTVKASATVLASDIEKVYPQEFSDFGVTIKMNGIMQMVLKTPEGVKGLATISMTGLEYPVKNTKIVAGVVSSGNPTGGVAVSSLANLSQPGQTYTTTDPGVVGSTGSVTYTVATSSTGINYLTPVGSNVHTTPSASGGPVVGTYAGTYYIY